MDAEKLNQALYDKMAAEQERFKHGLLGMTTEEALNHAYEYAMRQDILMEMEEVDLSAPEAAALLKSESPLADVYGDFREREGHMDIVRECIETLANSLLEAQREATRTIPLYQHTGEYAREHGELDAFRASYQANVACKEGIEAAIRAGFDGMYLNADVKGVLAEFGPERVTCVLAATLQSRAQDQRFSRSNHAWAAAVPMADAEDRRWAYVVNSHSAVLDGFVGMVRKEIAAAKEQEEMLSGLIANPHLYSTIHASRIDMETDEPIEALYDHAGQYQEAISHSIEAFRAQDYPSNDLMQYFKLPDNPKMERSIRQKIQSACVTVEASGPLLYARLDLSMTADLTGDELDAFTAQMESQYRDGWGAEFELQTIQTEKGGICLRLWSDDIEFFTAAEKGGFEQRAQQGRTEWDAVLVQKEDCTQAQIRKPSIKAQLSAKPVPGEQPAAKPKDREVR